MNWKTTAAGVGAILVAAGQIISGISHGDYSGLTAGIPALLAGVGLLFAHDAI